MSVIAGKHWCRTFHLFTTVTALLFITYILKTFEKSLNLRFDPEMPWAALGQHSSPQGSQLFSSPHFASSRFCPYPATSPSCSIFDLMSSPKAIMRCFAQKGKEHKAIKMIKTLRPLRLLRGITMWMGARCPPCVGHSRGWPGAYSPPGPHPSRSVPSG